MIEIMNSGGNEKVTINGEKPTKHLQMIPLVGRPQDDDFNNIGVKYASEDSIKVLMDQNEKLWYILPKHSGSGYYEYLINNTISIGESGLHSANCADFTIDEKNKVMYALNEGSYYHG